jgi:hypothetical protein
VIPAISHRRESLNEATPDISKYEMDAKQMFENSDLEATRALNSNIRGDVLGVMSPQPDQTADPEDLAKCPHCERTFFPHRLLVHLKSCKADRPLTRKRTDGGIDNVMPL